ncbi:hypothetical protein DK254_08350 [Pseudomonas sp. RW407]|uniref:hypothetical protein n=1 Tax=Pseudomonas sp. RW407 TaxID=2202894 RepID=UPI000D6EF594|nr:hypothetical protein [Pseudomonas sp. RW407]PWU30123.1 hypothetical protein DK254_08350 [Pseudomonas sp. RW407]
MNEQHGNRIATTILNRLSELGYEVRESGSYAKLEAENKALIEEIAALRKDKARLDRLDQLNSALNAKYGTTYRWQVIVNHNVNRLMLGHLNIDLHDSAANGLPSCRDALDTIMPSALIDEGKEAGHETDQGAAR